MPDHAGKILCDVGSTAAYLRVHRAEVPHNLLLVCAFVEFTVFKCDRECAQRNVSKTRDERDDRRGIQASAEVSAHGHVGP